MQREEKRKQRVIVGNPCAVGWILCPTPCPAHSYVEILTSRNSECDLIWRQCLYRNNQVKWGYQVNWCPHKKRKYWYRDIYSRKTMWRYIRRLPSTNQGERPGADLTLTSLRRNPSCSYSDFRIHIWYKSPELWANKFLLFKLSSLWSFVTTSQAN